MSILTPILSCAAEVNNIRVKNILQIYECTTYNMETQKQMVTYIKLPLKLDLEIFTTLLQGLSKEVGQGQRWKSIHPQEIRIPGCAYIYKCGVKSHITYMAQRPQLKIELKSLSIIRDISRFPAKSNLKLSTRKTSVTSNTQNPKENNLH